MSMLPDDTYDVFVIDANDATDDDGARALRVEVTVTRGAHKGEVVALRASNLDRDAIDLIGLPAELRVERGIPTITFD